MSGPAPMTRAERERLLDRGDTLYDHATLERVAAAAELAERGLRMVAAAHQAHTSGRTSHIQYVAAVAVALQLGRTS